MTAEITIGMLNWKRPDNIGQVVKSVALQRCEPQIWLWNNGDDAVVDDWVKHCHVVINSSHNLRCGAWAAMMSLCDTEFIGKIDDDLMMLDPDVLGDCIEYLRDKDHDIIVGMTGIALDPNQAYPNGVAHVSLPKDDVAVDIPKGRFHVVRRSALLKAPFEAVGHDGDVCWPGFLAAGRQQFHIIPGMLHNRFKNLAEGRVATCAQKGHYEAREALRRKWFSW